MEKDIWFLPAFDRRNPDPALDAGVGSVMVCFVLKGKNGAIVWSGITNWFLPHMANSALGLEADFGALFGYSYSVHSLTPMSPNQPVSGKHCDYLGGQPCYVDSFYDEDRLAQVLIAEGSPGVWLEMEKRYHEVFGRD